MTAPFCLCPRARHEHGTLACYRAHACRCAACVRVHARWLKTSQHRRRRIGAYTSATFEPSIGTARRLQALAACGWSADDLAPLTGMHAPNLVRLRHGHRPFVTSATAATIRSVYDQCWDQPPTGRYPKKVRNLAAKHRWLPPLHWDDADIDRPDGALLAAMRCIDHIAEDVIDDVAIEEALAGRPVPLTRLERREATARGLARGLTAEQVAERIGKTARTVERYKATA